MSEIFKGKLKKIDITEYKPYELNWKKHTNSQRRMFRSLLEEVGFVAAVVVNERTHHILDGHMRIEEAMNKGITKLPAVVLDVDENTEAKIVATFDMIGKKAVKKKEKLSELIKRIQFDDPVLNSEFQSLLEQEELMKGYKAPDLRKQYKYIVLVFKDPYNYSQACEEFGIGKPVYVEQAKQKLVVKVADGDKWSEKR